MTHFLIFGYFWPSYYKMPAFWLNVGVKSHTSVLYTIFLDHACLGGFLLPKYIFLFLTLTIPSFCWVSDEDSGISKFSVRKIYTFPIHWLTANIVSKQAGAELCQAHSKLGMIGKLKHGWNQLTNVWKWLAIFC